MATPSSSAVGNPDASNATGAAGNDGTSASDVLERTGSSAAPLAIVSAALVLAGLVVCVRHSPPVAADRTTRRPGLATGLAATDQGAVSE
ncbi:MAG: hypothetical protein LBG11_06700 [Bifidobacteriaceae bacterium]|jgi:hypothetical protein|nr:hypothetical protein [Bifidobacteriaceae bacterium]